MDELRSYMNYLDKDDEKEEFLLTRAKFKELAQRPQPTMADVRAEFEHKLAHSTCVSSSVGTASASSALLNPCPSTPMSQDKPEVDHVVGNTSNVTDVHEMSMARAMGLVQLQEDK